MKKAVFLITTALLLPFLTHSNELDNMLYPFNNAVRTLPNAPEGMDEQGAFIHRLGYQGFGGHHSEDYFARREALDKAGLEMPEIYLPVNIHEDGSVTFKENLKEIIKDSKGRNLVVALAAMGKHFENNQVEGDKYLVAAIQELADFAAPYGVNIAVYPHVNFYCERLDHSIKICKEVNRPNVGAIFNTCHLFKVEGMQHWQQKLKEAVPYLYMISVHGTDAGDTQQMGWDRLIQPLGEGSCDVYQIVKIAKDAGFEGIFGLQCYNIPQDCEVALTKSMDTWKSWIERYEAESKVQSEIIDDRFLKVTLGGQELFQYDFRPETSDRFSPRPFMHPIRTLAGDVITNSRPSDHPWHNGLSLTLTSVNGMNFWGGGTYTKETGKYREYPNVGKQIHKNWVQLDKDRWVEELDWIGPNGEHVFTETRTLKVQDVDLQQGMWRLIWKSELKNVLGETIEMNSYCSGQGLQGSGYTGLFMRMSRGYTLATNNHRGFVRENQKHWTPAHDGETVIESGKAINGWNSKRVAHQGIFDGSLNGGLLLCEDLTENPGYQHHWFYRPHMPCIAWSTAFHEPLTIEKDATFTFEHALGIVDGFYTEEQSNELWVKDQDDYPVTIMTLDPGHFHAALILKSMYEDEVNPTVYTFAPEGDDLEQHLKRIEGFNTRVENPTSWELDVYRGDDFFEKMIAEKPGDVMNVSGNNAKKTEYIYKTIEAGINVMADKPMVINPGEFDKLEAAFELAEEKGVLLYDVMTERFEITTVLQRELSQIESVFGTLQTGSEADPAITKESVHHFYKYVAGNPLKRPPWFFDTRQQGEGIVDVNTHLVDLIQWEAFPEVILSKDDVEIVSAKRWATDLTPKMFKKVTHLDSYPDYLKPSLDEDVLKVFSNGEINYKLKGIHAKASVTWNFQAPEGAKDTHYSIMRGTQCDLIIRQGKEQNYKPMLYVRNAAGGSAFAKTLGTAIVTLGETYPGLAMERVSNNEWKVVIPEEYKLGHEAHFAQVTKNYLSYLKQGALPEWEVPNMIVKYYTTTEGLKAAKAGR